MVLNNKKYKCVDRRSFDFTSEDVGYEWKISRMSARLEGFRKYFTAGV